MPRFFTDSSAISETHIAVTGEDARHIARSLRMAAGEHITVCDTEGTEYLCVLEKIRDDEVACKIESSSPSTKEPKAKITLYMAYPKGDKLETVIQKAVELGAYKIVPFESERCIKRPPKEKADKLSLRFNRIAEEAAKQCGRGVLPRVEDCVSFDALCSKIPSHELCLFCYEGDGTLSLKKVLEKAGLPKDIAVIVGCEGGFSEKEARLICECGAAPVNLGPRILRCETAPSFCLSALSFFFEL